MSAATNAGALEERAKTLWANIQTNAKWSTAPYRNYIVSIEKGCFVIREHYQGGRSTRRMYIEIGEDTDSASQTSCSYDLSAIRRILQGYLSTFADERTHAFETKQIMGRMLRYESIQKVDDDAEVHTHHTSDGNIILGSAVQKEGIDLHKCMEVKSNK